MTPDTFLMIGFGVIIGLFVVMLAVGIPRGKKLQNTNEQIARNQERLIGLSKRQAEAMERIAAALENRS